MRNELELELETKPNLRFISEFPPEEELESALDVVLGSVAALENLAVLVKKFDFGRKFGVYFGKFRQGLISSLIEKPIVLTSMIPDGNLLDDDFICFKFIEFFLDVFVFGHGHGDGFIGRFHLFLLKNKVCAAIVAYDMIPFGSAKGNVSFMYPVVVVGFYLSDGIGAIIVRIRPNEIALGSFNKKLLSEIPSKITFKCDESFFGHVLPQMVDDECVTKMFFDFFKDGIRKGIFLGNAKDAGL